MNDLRTLKSAILDNPKQKPPMLHVKVDAVPKELKLLDRWVCWLWSWNTSRGSWIKLPVASDSNRAIDVTDSSNWCSWDAVLRATTHNGDFGIGIVLGETETCMTIAGVDIDNCRDVETGALSDLARRIITEINSYTEVSPTGTGVKLLCFGRAPAGARTASLSHKVEMYDRNRYFAITGRHLEGTPDRVEHRQEEFTSARMRFIESDVSSQSNVHSSKPNENKTMNALDAMVKILPPSSENDGSKRMYSVCCRAKEYGLSDEQAIATIREYEERYPFPTAFTDEEIVKRLCDAKSRVAHTSPVTIANYSLASSPSGEEVKSMVPKPISEIADDIHREAENWPRRVGNVLFIDDGTEELRWLDKKGESGLFAWLKTRFHVLWKNGPNLVTRSELYAQLFHVAKRYDGIELLPHEPPCDHVYYRCTTPRAGDGSYLQRLLDKFRPETDLDRGLIQAALMTLFWGGPAGTRPVFVITSDAGRGVGKSKLAEIAAYIGGGALDVSVGETIVELKTRLLSPDGQTKRVAILDNVKSNRFSWAELEALITAPLISGRQMYVGEGQRSNLITWFITLNGVSLTTDMAQRSVIIKLSRGVNSGTWCENVRSFIDLNHDRIMADIVAALRSESGTLQEYSRWSAWEHAVLNRIPRPEDTQRLILDRQGEANCDMDEAQIIEDFFSGQLSAARYNPQTDRVRIPNRIVAEWFSAAIGESVRTATATRRLNQMSQEGQLKRITSDKSHTHGRSFIWTGELASVENCFNYEDSTELVVAA